MWSEVDIDVVPGLDAVRNGVRRNESMHSRVRRLKRQQR